MYRRACTMSLRPAYSLFIFTFPTPIPNLLVDSQLTALESIRRRGVIHPTASTRPDLVRKESPSHVSIPIANQRSSLHFTYIFWRIKYTLDRFVAMLL